MQTEEFLETLKVESKNWFSVVSFSLHNSVKSEIETTPTSTNAHLASTVDSDTKTFR